MVKMNLGEESRKQKRAGRILLTTIIMEDGRGNGGLRQTWMKGAKTRFLQAPGERGRGVGTVRFHVAQK